MKQSAYQSMQEDFENGNKERLERHQRFHQNDKARLSICYLQDCPLPPLINTNIDMLKKEVEMMTPKEYKIMCEKDFLKDFGIIDKKMILGKRDNE